MGFLGDFVGFESDFMGIQWGSNGDFIGYNVISRDCNEKMIGSRKGQGL